MPILTAREFREKYAIDHGHIDWNNMVDDTKLKDINNVEDDVMEKYAQYRVKELEELLEDWVSQFEGETNVPSHLDKIMRYREWKEQALKRLEK